MSLLVQATKEQWIKQYCDALWKDAQCKFPALQQHKLPPVTITTNVTSCAGKANWRGHGINRIVSVSYNLGFALAVPEDEFTSTLAHELAHCIQFLLWPHASQAHGPEFRAIMNTLGYDGSTYHSYNVGAAKAAAKAAKRFPTELEDF